MLRRALFQHFILAQRLSEGFRRRFSPLGHLLLFILLAAGVFGFNTRAAATYQLFTLLCALFGLAWLWSRLGRRAPIALEAERRLPRYATVGTALRYELILHNTGKRSQRGLSLRDTLAMSWPDWAEFAAAVDPADAGRNAFDRYVGFPRWQWLMRTRRGASLEEQALPELPPGQRVTVTLELMPLRRGRLQFAELCLYRPEPFGLIRTRHCLALPQTCCVLPRRYPMAALPPVAGRAYQRGGVALSNTVGDSEEFMALREYRHGDALRNIHWRSSAKFGRWLVKEFQEEYFVRRALVLDTFCPPRRADDLEAAISTAASLAALESPGDGLLDLMFVERQAHCFTAGRGVAQTSALLEVLAGVQAGSTGDFTVLAHSVLRRVATLSSVVLVLLDWDRPRRELCESLASHGLPVTVLLVDETPPAPPPSPALSLRHIRPSHLAEALLI
ncbi:MAG: DUF58 domain-containing protein [Methylococcaceae bacterium]|nr:MAG: DUF58 domain-containing protein [Methylococcaceae bacterium]